MTKINMGKEKNTDTPLSISEQLQSTDSEDKQPRHYSSVGDNPAEAILSFIAYTILILGIIGSEIVGGLMIWADYEWGKIGWIVLIGGVFASLIIWASLMILINISNNIRQIKHELRYMEYLLEESDSN